MIGPKEWQIFSKQLKFSAKDAKIKTLILCFYLVTLIHDSKKYFKSGIYNYQTAIIKDKSSWVICGNCQEEIVEEFFRNQETREKMNIKYIHDTDVMTVNLLPEIKR